MGEGVVGTHCDVMEIRSFKVQQHAYLKPGKEL